VSWWAVSVVVASLIVDVLLLAWFWIHRHTEMEF
jgi:hypothetical protein